MYLFLATLISLASAAAPPARSPSTTQTLGTTGDSIGVGGLGFRGPPLPASRKPALPKLEDAGSGLDSDLAAGLDFAQSRLGQGDPAAAIQTVLKLQLSEDRFSKAQLPLLAEPSKLLLRDAGKLASQRGRVEDAAIALDAAWVLDGKKSDPEASKALLALADKTADKGEALWLARRAAAADPLSRPAAEADRRLSENPYALPGQVLLCASVAGLVGGILFAAVSKSANTELTSTRHSREEADALMARRSLGYYGAYAGFAIGIGGYLGGEGLLSLGHPNYAPKSPAALPALPEAR